MRPLQTTFPRRVWIVLLLALAVRGAISPPHQGGDSPRFFRQAESILAGHGFGSDGRLEVCAPPGYPVFLAFAFCLSSNPWFLWILHLLLTAGSCLFLYDALRRHRPQCALVGMAVLAFSPLAINLSGYFESEPLTTFLASVLAWSLSVLTADDGRRRARWADCLLMFVAGVLLMALPLTAPGTMFLSAGVFVWLAWSRRRHVFAGAAMCVGCLALYVPWQVHCVAAVGRPIPGLYLYAKGVPGRLGVHQWLQTWVWHPNEVRAVFGIGKPQFLDNLPERAFRTPEEKRLCVEAYAALGSGRWTFPECDAVFEQLAGARRAEAPWTCRAFNPAIRALTLWIDVEEIWQVRQCYVGRLAWASFRQDQQAEGVRTAVLRYLKAIYSTVNFVLNWVLLAIFLLLLGAGLARREPVAIAVFFGVLGYTAASAFTAFGEVRRNLPFFPMILLLLAYLPLELWERMPVVKCLFSGQSAQGNGATCQSPLT